MRTDKKKASTLFALTLLIVALVTINLNVPAGVAEPEELIYLHGPSLQPIHMNSNITLTPVHMHHTGGVLQWEDARLYEPNCTTDWTKLYPNYDTATEYHLSSWEDNGDQMLSPNDQIDMTDPDGNVTWYHVDRMTVTLLLSPLPLPPYTDWPGPAEPTIAIELKWPVYFPEIKYDYNLPPNMITTWHQVWPNYSNIYNLTSWMENPVNPTFRLDKCDVVDLTDVDGTVTWWHVEDIATDLILREKIMDPKCTWWHEIYPEYCSWHHLTSWEDTEPEGELGHGMLSPCDQIDMVEEESGITTWYHVDRVTVTINVTSESDPTEWMKIELKTHYFEDMYEVFKYPWSSLWHEVYPRYSNVYNLTDWDPWVDDNCNFVLDPCDYIWLLNMTSDDPAAEPERWHIEDMTYDLILNKKISDPVCTDWQEVYPTFDNWYHVDGWKDNTDGLLSPCDYVNLTLAGGPKEEYHVENVTLTLNVASWDNPEEFKLIEAVTLFEEMYWPKTEPWAVDWHEVWPSFSTDYYIEEWEDNCNGVLDFCDNVTLTDMTGLSTEWHVEEVAVDMVVKRTAVEEVCGVNITNVMTSHCGTPVNGTYTAWTIKVNVTVHNNGTIPINCTVNAYYYNATNTYQIGAAQNIIDLDPCNTTTLTFNWTIAGLPESITYTVKANATCTCGVSDEFVNGQMKIRLWGDVNGKDGVTATDLAIVKSYVTKQMLGYLTHAQALAEEPFTDLNDDCQVTATDVAISKSEVTKAMM